MHKIGYIDCVQAKGLHCTLLSWSTVQTTQVTLMSHLLEKAFSHNQLQDASLRQGWGDLLSAAGLIVIVMLKSVSGGLLTFTYF